MNNINIKIEEANIVEVIGNVTSPFVVLSELIKNGVDANATLVTVYIDTKRKIIRVVDDGDGFTENDILSIGSVATSNKKIGSFIHNSDGEMLLGSKGLAFYSMFSLGKKIEVRSSNSLGEKYYFEWKKGDKTIYYNEVINEQFKKGTEILINEIDEDNILLLSSEKELKKFKHISLYNFEEKSNIPKIIVIKDDVPFDLEVEHINNFNKEFDAVVTFEYDNNTNILNYMYKVNDNRIPKELISIKLSNNIDANEILKSNYLVKPLTLSFDDYLTNNLVNRNEISIPSFNGKWFMKRGKKAEKFHKFEPGIRLYVNRFALYNYLNKNNDWLQLTNISQVKKINNFRQHNVYGYVNFNSFNEVEEGLKISNERGGFIENIYYHKFLDIIYKYILYFTINIDYALKNNNFHKIVENSKKLNKTNQEGIQEKTNQEGIQEKTDQEDTQEKTDQEDTQEKTNQADTQEKTDQADTQEKTDQEDTQEKTDQEGIQEKTNQEDDENASKILKTHQVKIQKGNNIYLLDPTIIDIKFKEGLKIVPQSQTIIDNNVFLETNSTGTHYLDYYNEEIKETLKITVYKRKVKGLSNSDDFFQHSNHFNGDIDLKDINGLVKQLIDLDYDEKYLLYVISFRAVLEDIVKKYYSKRNLLTMKSEFKDNITEMISDIQYLLKSNKNDPLKKQKTDIQKIFKGHHALNNFLIGVNVKFSNENYDKFLHSLTHNPSKIEKSLAIELANDIILPLYVLTNLLKEKNII